MRGGTAARRGREALCAPPISRLPQAELLAKSLLIDNTPEGLRIQIVDQEGLPMFPRGEAGMYTHTHDLLEMVAQVILEMPQAIAISGHTDAKPFSPAAGYSNWELSADRANAVRRALIESGVPGEPHRSGHRQGRHRAAASRRPRSTGQPADGRRPAAGDERRALTSNLGLFTP